jgi:hydroxyethylthiazole kinase-like uncharacterized protein yjeF
VRYILNREQIRSYDRLATELCKIPGLILMENAGRGAADIISSLVQKSPIAALKIAIVCGTGNNGGDGFVVARHLTAILAREFIHGLKISAYLIGNSERIAGDARVQFEAMQACGMPCEIIGDSGIADFDKKIQPADFIVDALFGTGLSRNIEGAEALVVEAINGAKAIRIALDIPSGLDADSGTVLGHAIRAQHTVTFAYPKPGLFTPAGRNHAGLLHCVRLGVPDGKILERTGIFAELIRTESIAQSFTRRDASTYKHKAGDILVVAGSPGKTGAAKLVAEAALRSGAGLATVGTWPDALSAFEKEVKEIMLAEINPAAIEDSLLKMLTKRSALVVGPGFGLDDKAKRAVGFILKTVKMPLVIDADALTICAHDVTAVKKSLARKILTPHSGELARILNISSAEVEADRFTAARRAAELTDSVVVLKGAHTIIVDPAGKMRISAEVNPVLATAGSGDVLAGIIGAFAAAMPPTDAAVAGVFIHAAAANLWSERTHSDRGMLAGDVALLIPEVIGQLNFPERNT